METITLPVYNTEGKEIDKIELDPAVFNGVVNKDVIYQAVNAYRANQRKGLASTKTMGEVSGGGKKPWKQKGTGRARVGSIRSPLWYHGGVVFGPHPRDFSYELPKKIRNAALKSVLAAKINDSKLIILESLALEKPKVKDAVKIFANLKVDVKSAKPNTALLLVDKLDNNLKLSVRNIGFLQINLAKNTHPYEVLAARKLIITKDGLAELVKRLKA